MPPVVGLKTREEVFDFLDEYASAKRDEIERKNLGKDLGLLKSYVIESTHGHQTTPSGVESAFHRAGWQLQQIGEDGVLAVTEGRELIGFVDPISDRFTLLHSYKKVAFDEIVEKTIQGSSHLDALWLAGFFYATLWQQILLPQMPERYVSMKFEHEARFEAPQDMADSNDEEEIYDEGFPTEDDYKDRRSSTSTITERAQALERFLPLLQDTHPPFRAIKMLRYPAERRGGYEIWSSGKVTYRASSFRDGRALTSYIVRAYENITRFIESQIWLQIEAVKVKDSTEFTLRGSPVCFEFKQPLSAITFQNLIDQTFDRGKGPFRLWGNPIRLGEAKAHVYGIDLHLWQRIYIEITPKRMMAILPRGTCGNTVHRLVTNIQRFIDPNVRVSVGDMDYQTIIRDGLLGRLNDKHAV